MSVGATTLPWVALLLLVAAAAAAAPVSKLSLHSHRNIGRFGGFNSVQSSARIPQLERIRGGAVVDDSDYDDYDSDVEEEDAEPIVVKTKKLAAATKLATAKKTAQRSAATKAKVSAAMSKSSGAAASSVKAKSAGSWYKRHVPYIVRACLNPFTLVAMTKAYFVSLMDINFLKEEPSQNLRSALEEKARKQPGAGQTKPKRKMKPGQAKTLSDLPQLSA
ncbi:hypothetical protein ACHAXS_013025 [Conticribra weissflogii]